MGKVNLKDFSFVILCPERNYGGLLSTLRSIRANFPDNPPLCVVGDDATDEELIEFNKTCPTSRGGKTYTALMNHGASQTKSAWTMFVMSGATVRHGLMRKYEYFCEGEQDIMFPVVDKKWQFDDASINCLLLNNNVFCSVGKFDENNDDLQHIKLIWCNKAMNKGYRFVGLVGVPR